MMNVHHDSILNDIKKQSGTPTSHTFLDGYLGNTNPRYSINAPKLRAIAKNWAASNRSLSAAEFRDVLDHLIKGPSSTEKIMAGIVMDYATIDQVDFDPKNFDEWLEYLHGWAEVDAVCTGNFTIRALPQQWKNWQRLLKRLAKSDNINKRRASLVFLCSPIRHNQNSEIRDTAFSIIHLLSPEKDILITKAISWLLRSMIKQHKSAVKEYIKINGERLPAIALRETLVKLNTGTKTKRKTK
jgi:3-methyladenine DNA glycosylase AlkD